MGLAKGESMLTRAAPKLREGTGVEGPGEVVRQGKQHVERESGCRSGEAR